MGWASRPSCGHSAQPWARKLGAPMSTKQSVELTEQEPDKRKKRALVLLVGLIAASGVGTLAYGYWTESGAGTGGGSTATTSSLTVNQTSTVSGLFPGS